MIYKDKEDPVPWPLMVCKVSACAVVITTVLATVLFNIRALAIANAQGVAFICTIAVISKVLLRLFPRRKHRK
jgi:hypothetical protein